MRLAVRLAIETKSGINELKEILKSEPLYSGLNLTNGFVVNQAYLETKDSDWEMVIKNPRIPKDNIDKKNLELQTNLDLSQETIDGINELKKILPQYLPKVSYVTTSYVIRIIVRSALLKKNGELKADNKE
ncbi:hypothetical protein [Brevibacillus laterosporus]|uniref:hypothetical protein n=1 Tax=Brevibacillus laterosporus TaxID=1465 RepID=UPI000E6CA7C6|nr:hypothetical protein [Brevibacillus laterosporus]AYB40076.1 hypothetical protein D5F52_18400 [Brevibacillus laterosporus]MBM7108489.1 hypothetical protein [Brevibacillus laterosporus]